MKILLVCMQHDYGDSSRGNSYEYVNYFNSLVQIGHEVVLFDFMAQLKRHGKARMNEMLLEQSARLRPDVAIFHLFTDQIDASTVDRMRAYTITLCIFHDDTWRVDHAYYWAPHFNYFTTPDHFAERKYLASGLKHALPFPYGCNEMLYYRMNVPKAYDVSFVGRWHPYRQWLIERLKRAGLSINARGPGWAGGMISHDEMVKLFNQSRINLNISNCASWDARYLASSPRALLDRIRSRKTIEQLKGRHFEINGCGGFQLSYYVEGLERHYVIGEEMEVYGSPEELAEKIHFYLRHEELRESIAAAGYRRTLSSHTFAARFSELFRRMGLAHE